jgi:hypothetical protein
MPSVLYPAVLAFCVYRACVQKIDREKAPLEARIELLESQLDESLSLAAFEGQEPSGD